MKGFCNTVFASQSYTFLTREPKIRKKYVPFLDYEITLLMFELKHQSQLNATSVRSYKKKVIDTCNKALTV